MFNIDPPQPPYLDSVSCKSVQQTSRHGRKANVIVLHSTGSGRSPHSVAKSLKVKKKPGSWHTVLDEKTRLNLVSYEKASCSNNLMNNLRTVNIGVCLSDKNWRRLIRAGKETELVYHIAYASAEANRAVRDLYSRNVPAVQLTRQQFYDGLPGFISHAELDGCSCFDNLFPWKDFLLMYERLMFPQKMSVAQLIAESAAVSASPGAVASALMKDYASYDQIGRLLRNSLPESMIIRNVFHRFADREPKEDEWTKMLGIAERRGIDYLLEKIAEIISQKQGTPSVNDLKLHQILSTAAPTTIGSGGLTDGLDTR